VLLSAFLQLLAKFLVKHQPVLGAGTRIVFLEMTS
jgi:hypothetical protein